MVSPSLLALRVVTACPSRVGDRGDIGEFARRPLDNIAAGSEDSPKVRVGPHIVLCDVGATGVEGGRAGCVVDPPGLENELPGACPVASKGLTGIFGSGLRMSRVEIGGMTVTTLC